MSRNIVVGDLRVQEIRRGNGCRGWTVVWPEGSVYAEADGFLSRYEGSGTQRTYAYLLVDHLRWLERECLTLATRGEYPRGVGHGMLLVQLHGADAGQPWSPTAARRMLGRAGSRAGLGMVRPHAFRHSFTTAVLDASGGNLLIARDAGGWASAAMVDEIYGHVDVHDEAFDAALRQVWGQPR